MEPRGRQPPAARGGRREGGRGAGVCGAAGAPSAARGRARLQPPRGGTGGRPRAFHLAPPPGAGAAGGGTRAGPGTHTGPGHTHRTASPATLLFSALLPPALPRAGLPRPGGREPGGWEGSSEVTSRNFPACGSGSGRCWTCPVPPGGRR